METNIVLVRHGETEWSRTGRHTGRTDVGLTERGRVEATMVGPTLVNWEFAHRLSSPLSRALDTAHLAGIEGEVIVDENLVEWDYGVYEGRTNEAIQADEPGWSKWIGELEGGESSQTVGLRADTAIDRLATMVQDGPVLVFAHGHFLAILIARWLDLDPSEGKRFILQTATASLLGTKRNDRVLKMLNHRCGSALEP